MTLVDKRSLRKQLRHRRQNLTAQQQSKAANRLQHIACAHRLYRKARHIAFYLANDGEIDPTYIIQKAITNRKICYLPVLQQNGSLKFRRYLPGNRLSPNCFGIFEPRRGSLVSAQTLDLIFMPLVGFDAMGNRLGMGGGYYDRSLAFKQNNPLSTKPRLIGLAHACQQIESIPADGWDIALDAIIFDTGVIETRAHRNNMCL